MTIEAITETGSHEVYKADNPNAIKINLPLLEAIADENCKAKLELLMAPVEQERNRLENLFLKVWYWQIP